MNWTLFQSATATSKRNMSPLRGLVGISSYGKNDFYNAPAWKHTTGSEFDIANVTKLPRVDIVFACADMASNAAFGIVKEFLPDLGRGLAKKHKKPTTGSSDTAPGRRNAAY